jgi:hypothetical protein
VALDTENAKGRPGRVGLFDFHHLLAGRLFGLRSAILALYVCDSLR